MSSPFVYFDLGNVLYRFCHDRMIRQMAAAAGMEPPAVRAVVFGTGLADEYERGEVSRQQFFERFCAETHSRPTIDALDDAVSDIFEPIPETLRIAEDLAAANVPRGILSNTNQSHWLFINRRFQDLSLLFPVQALSYEIGVMKPHPLIYSRAAELAGTPPAQLLFFDDRPENVAGAAAAGWNAVLFESPAQMRMELESRHLLS